MSEEYGSWWSPYSSPTTTEDYVVLNNRCSWWFTRLNQDFADKLVQGHPVDHTAVSDRPLRVYASFVQSGPVDKTYDELLRIVPYKSQDEWWEPTQIEYHPVRDQFIESIEFRLFETDGAVARLPRNRRVEARLHSRRRRRHASHGTPE